ncbi:O-antigen ligase family protein [Neobacillus cucumis]|uniref:O-antigen ligase family protein n=1 Tax=Neobacillus cucumis TaxID=1740721 RepID=UPI0015E097E5|nr:O-antigen ligase family protein [Neobacillus cucumis]
MIWTASKPKIKEMLPHLFQFSGASIALSMIFDYYGWVNYPHAIESGRFGGVFQYANTFGMAMALFFFYCLVNLTEEKIPVKKLFLQTSLSLIYFVCMIQSSSRGVMMFFPLIWLAGLLLLPVKKQLKYIFYSFISILAALIVYQSMIKEQSIKVHYPGFILLIVMMLISNVMIFFINRILINRTFPFVMNKWTRLALPAAIVVIFILGFLDLRYHGIVYHQLPVQLQDRLGSINLSTPTAENRLTFFKDALTMSKSSPIIGFGGGGWGVIYHEFQTFPYITNKIHNGYLEWIIDTGWLGFLLFLTVFGRFFFLLIHSYIKEKSSSLKISVILALLTIFLHSFVDFDFSFGTVWFLIFWLFAIVFSDLPKDKQAETKQLKKLANKKTIIVVDKPGKYRAILIAYACILIIGLIQSYRFLTAHQYYAQANFSKDNSMKELLIQKAIGRDPSNINYMLDLANIYLGQFRRTYGVEYRKKAEQLVENIGNTEPHNSMALYQIAHLSELLGNNDQALKYFNQALRVDHFNSSLYQDSIILKVNMAIDYRIDHNVEKSNNLINSAITDFQQEELWYGKIDHSEAGKKFYYNRNFYITPSTQYYTGIAYIIKKDYSRVVKVTQVPKDEMGDNLHALRILANEKLGIKNEIAYSKSLEKIIENLRNLLQKM